MLFIRVERKKTSYDYKHDPKRPGSWSNNTKHSAEDKIKLFIYEESLFEAKCQTVSNIPTGRYQDTIAPGPFLIRCFVPPRMYHCEVHGICQTNDIENQPIDNNCIQLPSQDRWLIHDDQKLKPSAPGITTSIPWSAGCFVLHMDDLTALNEILKVCGIKPGDTIDGELVEVDK